MQKRLLLFLILPVLTACAEFSEVHNLAKETSNLVGTSGQILGRRLRIKVKGGTEKQREGLKESFRAELEDGNLFHLVDIEEGEGTSKSGLLTIEVKKYLSRDFGSLLSDSEGWIVRYDLEAVLEDRDGIRVIEGPVAGIAYDDDTEVFAPKKILDIDTAAQRDAAVKLSDVLREEVEKKVESELGKVKPLKLARGVGPLRVAVIHVDMDQAHANSRSSQVLSDIYAAFDLAGNDLQLLNPQYVRQVLDQNNLTKFEGISLTEKKIKELRRVLPVRLVMQFRVRSRIQGVEIEGSITELGRKSRFLGSVSVRSRGVGALRVATIRLARKLLWRIGKTRFVVDEEDE